MLYQIKFRKLNFLKQRILFCIFLFPFLNAYTVINSQLETKNNNWYIGLLDGISFKNASKTNTFYKSFLAGPVAGIFAGYDFNHWKLEFQTSYRENPVNQEYSSVATSKTAEEWAVTFMSNGYYVPFDFEIVRPYIGAGVGYAVHSYAWHRHNPLSAGEFINFNHIRKYSNGFTYQAIAGLEFILNSFVNLNLEYCFWGMPWIHYGDFNDYQRVNTSFTDNLFLLKLTYKFP